MRTETMTPEKRTKRSRPQRAGFTLIELLVVISIIALLLSLLLPGLSSARRMGQRGACMAALRDCAKGMAEYATDNEDWIIGSPDGSGAYLKGETTSGYGQALQQWDWMGPMAKAWGYALTEPSKGDYNGCKKRFNELRSNGAFLCAGNKFLATAYTAGNFDAGAGWMVSFNTQRLQLSVASGSGEMWTWGGGMGNGHLAPSAWKPILGRIGPTSEKIFVGDGARYSSCADQPDYDLAVNATSGGFGADASAYSGWSRSYDRCRAPGNGSAPGGHTLTNVDPRFYAYRHSTGEPPIGAPGNAFKASFAYYDGHVETLGDLESSSPFLWLPSGSQLPNPVSEVWPDAISRFGLGTPTNIGQR
jgi:prepilin-type N-terminal cleavage/methylation domain-containing protein